MTPAELRRREILRTLELEGSVWVAPLARLFGVSEVTVRSDLALLERQGRLSRVHGGGVRRGVAGGRADQPARYSRPRRWIAERAAALVDDGDTILLDGSATALLIGQRLHDRRDLRVVTNSVTVARALGEAPGITVYLVGGLLRVGTTVTVSSAPAAPLQVRRAFVSPDALSFEDGLMGDDPEAAETLRRLVAPVPELIALVDSTVIARIGAVPVATLAQVTRLLVDERIAGEHLARLRDEPVAVTVCGEHRSTYLPPRGAPGRRWRIGFANVSEDVGFAITVRRSIERAAASVGSVDLVLADNRIDGPTALRNVERFIEAGVDLVIEYLHLAQYGEVIMSRLRGVGIPAISINAPMAGARYFGVDNYLVGREGGGAAGRAAAARWGHAIDRAIVVSLADASENTLARTFGQLEALREWVHVPDERVFRVSIRPLRAEARAAVADILAAWPNDRRIVILNTNDDSALGAADAVMAAGRTSCVVIAGQGGDPDVRVAIADPGSPIVGTVAYHPDRYGDQLIAYALDILEGRTAPPAIVLGAELLARGPTAVSPPAGPRSAG